MAKLILVESKIDNLQPAAVNQSEGRRPPSDPEFLLEPLKEIEDIKPFEESLMENNKDKYYLLVIGL